MKVFSTAVAGALLVGSAIGRPHAVKRAVVTQVVYTTVVSDVVVYVDHAGVPWSTATVTSTVVGGTSTSIARSTTPTLTVQSTVTSIPVQPLSTSTPAPAPAPASSKEVQSSLPPPPTQKPVEPVPVSTPQPQPQVSVPPPQSSSPPPAVPSAKPQAVDGSFPLGITWDPFSPNGCKTDADWDFQWGKMAEQFKIVRIYGVGCNNIPNAIKQAKKHGLKLMVGAYVPEETVDNFVQVLTQAIKDLNSGNWNMISIVSIGNERINEHMMTASDAVSQVNNARVLLRKNGYTGPVGVADTVPAMVDNPSLCDQSDLVLVNIHAYWDSNAKPEDSGSFVQGQVQKVKNACKGKRVIVTESGWPRSDGKPNSKASTNAQQTAVKSIRDKFSQDLFLFTAFDTLWRHEPYEKHWGILQQ